MNILVTGISGYIGSRLAPRLVKEGHAVRGFARRPVKLNPEISLVTGDAVSGKGLAQALEGIDVAYFLIHSMEPSRDGTFDIRERAAAENFARTAEAAAVRRIVYLGGMMPPGGPASPHLASRLAIEEVLLEAAACPVVLRASIVVGAGSRSFRFLVRLVERMPVLLVPAWHRHHTNPIDERDMVELLARAAVSDGACGQSLDAAGPETVSYGELIARIREHMLVDRGTIAFRRLSATPIASRISARIAEEEYELIGPLMESLEHDLPPRDERAAGLLEVRLHSLDAAIEHALREWERAEPLAAR